MALPYRLICAHLILIATDLYPQKNRGHGSGFPVFPPPAHAQAGRNYPVELADESDDTRTTSMLHRNALIPSSFRLTLLLGAPSGIRLPMRHAQVDHRRGLTTHFLDTDL